MIDQWILRIVLFPFAMLYRLIVGVRGLLYEAGLLKSVTFDIPVISVGNLNTGGSGKTPMIEYLIRQLSPYIKVSVLSRGYKRKTKGYRNVSVQDTFDEVGDEPLLLKKKYPAVPVAVGEDRALSIPQLLQNYD
ncbi:MAG TPA: tetraacyldisaccharide 4'-kinase, partial [Membranihabitans sp.]|nr:tetraacyldisaccharide 4'-kinase [Membranihabitans sp.]